MLQKAAKEGIVADYINLYDHFFTPGRESSNKVAAARLPYFYGDFWSEAVEDFVNTVEKESKKYVNKSITKATMKALGLTNSSDAMTKELLLTHEVSFCFC